MFISTKLRTHAHASRHARAETQAGAAKYMHTCARHAFQDELRHARTFQGAFEARFLHFDHPDVHGRILQASDQGRGARVIRQSASEEPTWRILWHNSYVQLPPVGKRVLNALMQDWRSRVAGRIARVSHKSVDAWKKKFQNRFRACLFAWKHDSGR